MSSDREKPNEPLAALDRWVTSAMALKMAIKRTADPVEAERWLDDHLKSGALTARCTVIVEGWDCGAVHPTPPIKKSRVALSIQRAASARAIELGGAFWQGRPSRFEDRVWQWKTGIFIYVVPPIPILKTSPRNSQTTMLAQKRLVAYGVEFIRDEVSGFVSKLPAFPEKLMPTSRKQKIKRTKWSWKEAIERVEKTISMGIVDGQKWRSDNFGALARIEAELSKELIDLDDGSASESSIRRHAQAILDRS